MTRDRIVAILQARTGSQRLPAKVLMPIGERSMLERVVERIERLRTIDDFIIATSVSEHDDTVAQICAAEGWNCFRGPEQDVLERHLRAAQAMQASHIVRIGADCPLFSWQQADRVIAQHVASGSDYAHNMTAWGSGMPLGTGVEVMTLDALGMAWTCGLDPAHREHVTQYIHDHRERFTIEMLRAPEELDRPGYRLTVDTIEDLHLLRTIHERVAPEDGIVDLREAVLLLDEDEALSRTNRDSERRAG